MNLYESTSGHVAHHVTKVIKHVIEHKAANKLVDKAVSTGKTAVSGSKGTAKPKGPGVFSNIHSPLQFFWHFPIALPIVLFVVFVGGYVGLNMLWKKLDIQYNIKGLPLAPWKDYVRKIRAIMFKEDLTQLFTKPAFLAQKFPKVTWRDFWKTMLIAVIVEFILLMVFPSIIVFALLLPLFIAGLIGSGHIKQVFSIRMRTLMQMFEVAESVMKYQKGANLNPWGYIIITSWGNPEAKNFTAVDNLYSPGPTYVMFNAKFPSDDVRNREAFERNFNGTVSDQHTWTYEWESANNRVLCTPVPFIPATIVPYPFPDRKPWNIFPLGEAAGGKEAFFDVKVFPHLLVAGVTGSGKLGRLTEKIPVPISEINKTGWTTFGDIKIGDRVFDENGKPCKVFGVSEINNTPELYRVHFSDNSTIDVSGDHLWRTEDRVSLQSRWRSQRDFQRRELLSKEGRESLDQLLATLNDKDEVTIEQIASVAKVHPTSTWLYDLAREVGQVGEVKIIAEFHYNEQIVKQRQKVTRYPAKQTWEALSTYKARPGSVFALSQNKFATKAMLALETDTVSSIEVAKEVGYPTLTQARALLRRAGIQGKVGVEIVELKVPAKTLTRETRFANTYPAIEFVELILEFGKKIVNDQRDKRTYSAIRTTKEIMDTLYTPDGKYLNHSIPVAPPLDLPKINLPIAPYAFGAWLGDGESRQGSICGIDNEIVKFIESEGFIVLEKTVKNSPNHKPRHKDFRIWKIQGLTSILKNNNLLQKTTAEGTKKHIPAIYLRASIEQRKALLAGLLDTDGNVGASGGVEFTNTNREIAYGTLELARSLGYRATITESRASFEGKDYGPKWTVAFTCAESPFRLTRKTKTFNERGANKNSEKTDRRYITNIEKIESAPGRCIQVDSPSRMFLAGEAMIPTHNSVTQRTLLMHALQSPDWRIALVDPKRVELSSYKTHPHVVAVATELDQSMALIEKVEQEMQSRYIAMQKEGVNFFKNLATPPPALLLMVDETYALLAPEKIKNDEGKERDEWHARITLLIGSIARLGRAAGVHMILATQRPDAAVLPGETKANLDARIAQGRMDSTPSNMTLDSDAATRIPNIKGRAVLRTGNDFTEFQAYFLPEQQLDLVLEMAGALATGQVGIEAFDDEETITPVESGKRFRLPKLSLGSLRSLRLPRLPTGLKGRLGDWLEGRKALAEANDARSKAAIEGAKASQRGSRGERGSQARDEELEPQRGSRGSNRGRKPLPVDDDEDYEDEELDIGAIAEAARARGPIEGMNLNPNGSEDRSSNLRESEANRRAGIPLPKPALDYSNAEEVNLHELEDESELDYEEFAQDHSSEPKEYPSHSTHTQAQEESKESEVVEEDPNAEDERERNIRLAASQEEQSLREAFEASNHPAPAVKTVVSQVPAGLVEISVEEVLRKAAQRGVPIPASELLAALRYEAAIEAAGGKATPIPVPINQGSVKIVESVPVPIPMPKPNPINNIEPQEFVLSDSDLLIAVPMPVPIPMSNVEAERIPIEPKVPSNPIDKVKPTRPATVFHSVIHPVSTTMPMPPLPRAFSTPKTVTPDTVLAPKVVPTVPIPAPVPPPPIVKPVQTPPYLPSAYPDLAEVSEAEEEIIEAPWMPKEINHRDGDKGSTPFGHAG